MGRATSGVKGMRFREDDELLSMNVVRAGTFVFTATDGGYAKRTAVDEYRVAGPRRPRHQGGQDRARSAATLVGALVVEETDEVLAITARRRGDPYPGQRACARPAVTRWASS